jgi:hypothetical protein
VSLAPSRTVVIETGGAIEQVDTLMAVRAEGSWTRYQ